MGICWYCKYGISYRKVRGKWKYLFRAINQEGRTLDFYLPATRNAKAAKRFLAKALKRSRHNRPGKINTDKNPAYGETIRELKRRSAGGGLPPPAGEIPE